jgi:hypothetical protein
MSIIRTKRNHVSAYEPLDRDIMVETLLTFGTGSNSCRFLTVQPIDRYQAAVDWAVSIADQFELPIQVVPIDVIDFVSLFRTRGERGLPSMTPELWRDVATTCAEVMRDCNDPAIRAKLFDLLVKMKIVSRWWNSGTF